MPSWLQTHPFWMTFAFLWLVAMARGQATYWLGRWACEQAIIRRGRQGLRARLRQWLLSNSLRYGKRFVDHWGLAAIPLCYVTVGLQSLVLAAAGVLRIGWVRFSCAQTVGALLWSGIYTTIGWAMWQVFLATAARHWWPVWLGLLALGAGGLLWRWRASRARVQPEVVVLPGQQSGAIAVTTGHNPPYQSADMA